MKSISLCVFSLFLFLIAYNQNTEGNDVIIANGQMPCVDKDKNNAVHIVYGSGDSIMYISSRDGVSFGSPSLVAVLPELFDYAMRGPQIVATANGLLITACNKKGNIFSYKKGISGKWSKAVKINDVDETAKEGLMALDADGSNTYAVWLGVKNPKGQNVYGAKSLDGGKTWSKNILVYSSPDNTVCECCKPSVAIKNEKVVVMFRNWLGGNRDMYLIESSSGGRTFGKAKKLGEGSWKLNGCPMDGGGIVINERGNPETVWRREGKIYASAPGMAEKEIGEGRNCSLETINSKNIYAWTENGNVMILKPGGLKVNMGKGSLPLLKALDNEQFICIWENEKQIHAKVIAL
jgi:hypothetical protein